MLHILLALVLPVFAQNIPNDQTDPGLQENFERLQRQVKQNKVEIQNIKVNPFLYITTMTFVTGNAVIGGSMTASSFWGDGTHITGVPAPAGLATHTMSRSTHDATTNATALRMVVRDAQGGAAFAGLTVSSMTSLGSAVVGGSITASSFWGDGANITGLAFGDLPAHTMSRSTHDATDTATALRMLVRDAQGGAAFTGLTVSSLTSSGSSVAGGSITASSFWGDGAHLSGISSTAAWQSADAAIGLDTATLLGYINSTGTALTVETVARISADYALGASTKATNTTLAQVQIDTATFRSGLDSHTMSYSTHGATDMATANRIVVRNSGGGASFAGVTISSATVVGSAAGTNVDIMGLDDQPGIVGRDSSGFGKWQLHYIYPDLFLTTLNDIHLGNNAYPDTLTLQVGRVGVQNTSPAYGLDVSSGVRMTGQLIVEGTATVKGDSFNVGVSSLVVASGRVGIGTTSPATKFHISSGTLLVDGNSDVSIQVGASTMVLRSDGTMGLGVPGFGGEVGLMVRSQNNSYGDWNGNLILQDNSAMAANVGGGVSFGGQYKTDGSYTNTYGFIKGIKENGTSAAYGGGLILGTRPPDNWPLERMRITSGGKVGIGTTSPITLLHLEDSASTTTKMQVGSATKAACIMLGDTDLAGCTECFALNGTLTCTTDADCLCDGS